MENLYLKDYIKIKKIFKQLKKYIVTKLIKNNKQGKLIKFL